MPTSPSPESLAAFLAVVAFVLAAPVFAWTRWAKGSVLIASAVALGWALVTALPSGVGLFTQANAIPRLPLFLVGVLTAGTAFAFSRAGTRLADSVPLVALVAVQGFRVPLELVLHSWAEQGVVPPQMTWTSANIDIVSGVVALFAAPFVLRWKAVAWLSLIVGFGLLINVVRIVVQSFGTPIRMYDEPVWLALSVPEVWIATICVCGAWACHLITLRKLWRARP